MSGKIEIVNNTLDIIMKGSIAALVAIGGYQFKKLADDIERLKIYEGDSRTRISVVENTSVALSRQLEKMDNKIDKILDRVK